MRRTGQVVGLMLSAAVGFNLPAQAESFFPDYFRAESAWAAALGPASELTLATAFNGTLCLNGLGHQSLAASAFLEETTAAESDPVLNLVPEKSGPAQWDSLWIQPASLSFTAVPEPNTAAMLGLGAFLLWNRFRTARPPQH